jgi:hypothetical protein
VTSPAELDCLRKPLLIGHVVQAERSADKAGVRATASRRHDRGSGGQSERA